MPPFQLIKKLFVRQAHGPSLTRFALIYGLERRWYERIPWLGDRWLRRRTRWAMRNEQG
jgi:hypothetical protein